MGTALIRHRVSTGEAWVKCCWNDDLIYEIYSAVQTTLASWITHHISFHCNSACQDSGPRIQSAPAAGFGLLRLWISFPFRRCQAGLKIWPPVNLGFLPGICTSMPAIYSLCFRPVPLQMACTSEPKLKQSYANRVQCASAILTRPNSIRVNYLADLEFPSHLCKLHQWVCLVFHILFEHLSPDVWLLCLLLLGSWSDGAEPQLFTLFPHFTWWNCVFETFPFPRISLRSLWPAFRSC